MPRLTNLNLRFGDRPYVGQLGETNTLMVEQRPDRIICRVTRGRVWFSQIIFSLWALFLSFMIWTSFGDRKFHIPLPFSIIIWILAAVCWLTVLRTLLGTPRVEVQLGDGGFLFYRFNTRTPSRVINRSEVKRISVDIQLYAYRSTQTANYMVSLILVGDEKVPLCASPSEHVIRLLETQLTTGTAA